MLEEQQFSRLDDDVGSRETVGSRKAEQVMQPQREPLQTQPVEREQFGGLRVLAEEPRQVTSERDELFTRQQRKLHTQDHALSSQISPSRTSQEQASAKLSSSKDQENLGGRTNLQVNSSKDRPSTPDIIKELEDLMGGVEAMVSSPDFTADGGAPDQKVEQTTASGNEPHSKESRQEEGPVDANFQKAAKKLTVQDIVKEDRLLSPLKSPRQSPQFQNAQELQTSTGMDGSGRSSEEKNRSMLSPGSSQADHGDDIIDPPTPWRNNVESPPSNSFTAPEDNLANVSVLYSIF